MKDMMNITCTAHRQLDLLECVKALLTSGCADDSTAGISNTKSHIIRLCEREQQRQLRRLDRANIRIKVLIEKAGGAA